VGNRSNIGKGKDFPAASGNYQRLSDFWVSTNLIESLKPISISDKAGITALDEQGNAHDWHVRRHAL
jgi:hypothetical protein